MGTENCTGVEVTFAAILASQECGDFEAIEAAEKGGEAWDDYVAHYVGGYTHKDFTLALLTRTQSADLRWQVLEQAARLPRNRAGAERSFARQAGDEHEHE